MEKRTTQLNDQVNRLIGGAEELRKLVAGLSQGFQNHEEIDRLSRSMIADLQAVKDINYQAARS